MTLIRCPECHREISDAASVCPGCGLPLSPGMLGAGDAMSPSMRLLVRYEYRSRISVLGLPLIHVRYGPAWLTGFRPARGIVAIGNVAVGVVAFGGIAIGGIAIGGLTLGLLSAGGVAIGLGLGLGGIATGYYALGGIAIGVGALGGLEIAKHTLRPM